MFTPKLFVTFFSTLILGLLTLNSCEKEVTLGPTPPFSIPDKEFFAVVDGFEFADTVLWGVENVANSTILIRAELDGGYPRIELVVPNDILPGTYELGGSQSMYQGHFKLGTLANQQFSSVVATGNLIITKHDMDADYIVGTFDFLALPSTGNTTTFDFSISNGSFTVSY
jgi:hypothetical protein